MSTLNMKKDEKNLVGGRDLRSKRMRKAYDGLVVVKPLSKAEAIQILKERSSVKFDETLEVTMVLDVDPKHSDQNVRGMVNLPHGTGKKVRIAVFARDDKAAEAKKAGADIVGAEDLADEINKNGPNFDICIASPDMMGVVGRVAKVLGPKGLMPNPKLGTVTPNVAKAVENAKAGQVEFRVEKQGIIQAGVGKLSFDAKKLAENLATFTDAVIKAKPASVKGAFVKKVVVSSTMGPGLPVDLAA